jgi:hypothetical protein
MPSCALSQNDDRPWRHAAAQCQRDSHGIYQPNGKNNMPDAVTLYLLPAHLQTPGFGKTLPRRRLKIKFSEWLSPRSDGL